MDRLMADLVTLVIVVPISWLLLGFLFLKMKSGLTWAYFAYVGWAVLALGVGMDRGSYGAIGALAGVAVSTAIGVWLLEATGISRLKRAAKPPTFD